jgi:hypothetical protein
VNHVLVGAALPYLVSVALYVRRGYRASNTLLIAGPAAMAIFGLWAVIPDIPRALGMDELYYRFHRAPKSDLFFFHHTIDHHYEETTLPYTIGFILVGLSLLGAAWRELHLRERRAGS